jgi:hypothetical protein
MPTKSTSFYNNYYLEDKNKTSNQENILKNDFTLDYNDYEKLKIAEQYNKLYSNIYGVNKENIALNENNKIFDFNSPDFFKKSGKAYISIMNDFVLFINDPNKSFNKFGIIFTKENNLIYIGFAILIFSFMIWLIDITS